MTRSSCILIQHDRDHGQPEVCIAFPVEHESDMEGTNASSMQIKSGPLDHTEEEWGAWTAENAVQSSATISCLRVARGASRRCGCGAGRGPTVPAAGACRARQPGTSHRQSNPCRAGD